MIKLLQILKSVAEWVNVTGLQMSQVVVTFIHVFFTTHIYAKCNNNNFSIQILIVFLLVS